MADETLNLQKLFQQSREALEKAYCPYSSFAVGAALLCEDGKIITGCNVENASYGLTICAERTAVCKAVSEGYRKFKAIAIATKSGNDSGNCPGPCGACRQFLAEFGLHWDIYIIKSDGTFIKTTVAEILPMAFTPEHLANR